MANLGRNGEACDGTIAALHADHVELAVGHAEHDDANLNVAHARKAESGGEHGLALGGKFEAGTHRRILCHR